jgi:hypothetical protein
MNNATNQTENNGARFEVGQTYEGAGFYGDVSGVVVKRSAQFVTIKTSIPTPFRVKVRKDGNGEVIYPGAWCIRATDIKK